MKPTKKRARLKNRGGRRFAQVWHSLLDDNRYIELSHPGKTLLIDVLRQYNGKNNGDMCITLSVMKKRGWNSNSTLRRALNELLQADLIIQTRQGGRHKCSLYGLTWEPIDECNGKLDISSTTTPLIPLSIKNSLAL